MFGKKKSNVPDDSNRPGLDWQEYLGLLFSFLWFHRGIVLAALVLWGLYFTLTKVKNQVAETKRRDKQAPAFVFVPQPAKNKSLTGEGFENPATRPSDPVPAEPVPLVSRPKRKVSIPKPDADTIRFDNFVATAGPESLFEKASALLQKVAQVNPTEAVLSISRRRQITNRLREMELTEKQQELLTIAELESLGQLDAINIQHAMEIPGIRDELSQLAVSLLDHPQDSVSSKAHLAVIAARAVDLLIDPTREELALLADAYQAHIDNVMRGSNETIVVTNLLQTIIDYPSV